MNNKHEFSTDFEFHDYVDTLFCEWRKRKEATEDFDEWKVAEIKHSRKRISELKAEVARLKSGCGKPGHAAVTSDEGTSYCLACELGCQKANLYEQVAELTVCVLNMADALDVYSECRDEGCTCGDGWSHDAAKDVLDDSLVKQVVARLRKELEGRDEDI